MIGVWWIGSAKEDRVLLHDVRDHVAHEFGERAVIVHAPERPGDIAFDAARGQHLTRTLLAWLDAHRPAHVEHLVALTDADLFIPILTHVFGEARLSGHVAVVSRARMEPATAGEREHRLGRLRTLKEATHELGHTFGLLHCDDSRCVMTRSPSVRQVDAKRPHLCNRCRDQVTTAASPAHG